MSLAALTQPDIVEMVEAAALLSPISYLEHVTAPLVLRMVAAHLDQVYLVHYYSFTKQTWFLAIMMFLDVLFFFLDRWFLHWGYIN